jgi:hypothetical protein
MLAQNFPSAGFKDIETQPLSTTLHYDSPQDACGDAFAGGPVVLAYSRFDTDIQQAAHAEYLASIEACRSGDSYAIPGEFVAVSGRKISKTLLPRRVGLAMHICS